MSNIKRAFDAIKAEIQLAREGAAYYQDRIESLEDALARITGVDAVQVAAKKGRAKREPVVSQERKSAKKTTARAAADKLPSTGKEFWPSLLGAEPMSSAEIFNAAVAALAIQPNKDQSKKLAQRQANALSILTKEGVISSTGKGRERRYFK